MRAVVESRALLPPHDKRAHLKVLRAVASLELVKGLIVLAGGFGILFLVHKDTGDVADWCLSVLHISPDHHFAQVFLDWADALTAQKLWAVAGVAAVYSILRFIEAYGLWRARAWAEWIALISGTLYVPFEVMRLMHRVNLFHSALLIVNLAVVFYMAFVLFEARGQKNKFRET